MNEITKSAEARQALRWLARELAWERALTAHRDGQASSPASVREAA